MTSSGEVSPEHTLWCLGVRRTKLKAAWSGEDPETRIGFYQKDIQAAAAGCILLLCFRNVPLRVLGAAFLTPSPGLQVWLQTQPLSPVSRGRRRAPLCVPAMVSPSPSSCDSSRTAVSCSPSILDALWEMTRSSVRVSRTGCCLVDLQEQRTLPVRSLVACACPQEGKPFSLGHC